MRSRSALAVGALLITVSLSACASPGNGQSNDPTPASESADPAESADATAVNQAQAWLEAAALPPGAVRAKVPIGGFTSYTGWPCGPAEELEAFWRVPGTTVADTANWLMQNPTANLETTAIAPYPADSAIDSAIVGYIPELGAQEGIVFTVINAPDGAVVRAEIAALTEAAVCPELPDGGIYGAPGQG